MLSLEPAAMPAWCQEPNPGRVMFRARFDVHQRAALPVEVSGEP